MNRLTSKPLIVAFATGDVLFTDGPTGVRAFDASKLVVTSMIGSLAALSSINNSNWSGTALAIGNGGTGATTASGARVSLLPSYAGNGGKILALNAGATDTEWIAAGGGTVTSVSVVTANGISGSVANPSTTPAITLSLGAINPTSIGATTPGTGAFTSLTLTDDLAVTHGGTGASDAAGARTNLGLVIGTNVQAYHANLAAFAGLSLVADRLPYANGTGTLALATLTAAGRALLDDADAAAQRATLGLVIGTNVQAYDAELAAIAGLTSAADRLPYFTGPGTASLATFTSFGRNLVDDADAAAGRTTLGLGTIATQAASSVALTGGSIDNTAIGATTPSTGVFTSVSDSKGEIRLLPQNSQSAAYTLVLADAGKHILHPSADTTARTFTIPANSSVAYPVGTAITFVNQNGAGAITIAITTDTMRLAGDGTTGSRTLAANGVATALKITSTEWIISGTGLT